MEGNIFKYILNWSLDSTKYVMIKCRKLSHTFFMVVVRSAFVPFVVLNLNLFDHVKDITFVEAIHHFDSKIIQHQYEQYTKGFNLF